MWECKGDGVLVFLRYGSEAVMECLSFWDVGAHSDGVVVFLRFGSAEVMECLSF